jgi:hypothetical protein
MPDRPRASKGSSRPSPRPLGAYGLRFRGLGSADSLLVPASPGWQAIDLVRRVGRASAPSQHVSHERAEINNPTGTKIVIDRSTWRAVFTTPRLLRDEELIHPYLAPVSAVVSLWLDRESFHAGAFVANGGAWALLGEKESGKSTMLAWLALHGYEALCDDVLVLEGPTAFAGPRSVDLRAESAHRLGAGEPLGVIGARERWRLNLGPVEAELPLRGWIFLDWGPKVELTPVSGIERLVRLPRHRFVRFPPPTDPAALLEQAALPGWELRRPRGWNSLPEATRRLLEAVAG